MGRYWITSGRGTRANAAPGTKYHSEKKAPMPVGARRTCRIFFVPFVFATASEIAGLISHCTGSVIDSWRCRLNWFRCRTGCADRRPGWFRTVALWVGTTAGEPLALCGKRMVTGSNSRKLPLSSTQPPWAWAGSCGQSCILGQTEGYTGRPPSTSAPSVHRFPRHSFTSSRKMTQACGSGKGAAACAGPWLRSGECARG